MPLKPHPTDSDKMVYESHKYDFETSPRHALQAEYERGFIDGMQKQMQSSVDRALNAMAKREWVGLTDEERLGVRSRVQEYTRLDSVKYGEAIQIATEQALKEKNT